MTAAAICSPASTPWPRRASPGSRRWSRTTPRETPRSPTCSCRTRASASGRWGANLGFAAANNRVAQDSRAEFLALLKPRRPARSGVAGRPGRGRRRPSRGRKLRLRTATARGAAPAGRARRRLARGGAGLAGRRGLGRDASAGRRRDLLALRRGGPSIAAKAFVEAGGFDERFFCYCEDVDLGHRLRASGRRVAYGVSAAVVRHAGSGISGRTSDFTMFHGHRNRIWTFVKNTPGAVVLVASALPPGPSTCSIWAARCDGACSGRSGGPTWRRWRGWGLSSPTGVRWPGRAASRTERP